MNNIVISVLGHKNSGKTSTWNQLFGRTVRTGSEIRRLNLNQNECVEVFLVSGSPEERETYIGNILGDQRPRIILCSLQYRHDVYNSFNFFLQNYYAIYCQWLNPGYSDPYGVQMFDKLGIINFLVSNNSTVTLQNGKLNLNPRVQLIKQFIYGWAQYKNLILPS